MKTIKTVVLILAIAGFAAADPVRFDFGAVTPPVNITNAVTAVDVVQGGVTINTLTVSYDPQDSAAPLARCGFDPSLGGTQFTFDCVGGTVDTSGIVGTTEGGYMMSFAVPLNRLSFSYSMFTLLNPLDFGEFSANALFFLNGEFMDQVTSTSLTGLGVLDYAGSQFNEAHLVFLPQDPFLDPNTGLAVPGQTLVRISDVASVPEPSAMLLLGAGLGTILGCGWFRRTRRK